MTIFTLIALVFLLMLGQAWYYYRHALDRVTYTRHFSRERVYAGDSLEMIEVLINDKLFPIPWVRVEARVSPNLRFGAQSNLDIRGEWFHKSIFYMSGYKKITRRHTVTALSRGYYDCSRVSVTAGDLLGLTTCSRDMRGDARLLVYPRLAAPEELPQEALQWQGEVSVRRWTDPDPILVTGIRDYQRHDSRRSIHWGATARTGTLQVKVRDYTVSPRLLILLNTQIRESLWGAMEPSHIAFLEKGVSLAASLAVWAAGLGLEVGLRTNGGSQLDETVAGISIDPRPDSASAILEALAALQIKMALSFPQLLDREIAKRTSGMDILCISPYWSAALEERAADLKRMGNSVRHIPLEGGAAQ